MAKKIQFGVMQRGVFPRDEDMGAHFQELMEQARVLDKLGYDSVTTGSTSPPIPIVNSCRYPIFAGSWPRRLICG